MVVAIKAKGTLITTTTAVAEAPIIGTSILNHDE